MQGKDRCEKFQRAMQRYRPRFRGDIEDERSGRAKYTFAPPHIDAHGMTAGESSSLAA